MRFDLVRPRRLVLSCALLVASVLAVPIASLAEKPTTSSAGDELRQMFEADQADRSGDMYDADWEAISQRDAQRRARVMVLYEAGRLRTAEDFYHSAMVYQHGEGVEDIRWARDWAQQAVELAADDDDLRGAALWLFAAATDRHLHRQGKPQIYGTQFVRDPNGGPWTMEPFDRTAVSDEDRAAHGVRTIEEQEARLETMNAGLRERGLADEGGANEEGGESDDGDA